MPPLQPSPQISRGVLVPAHLPLQHCCVASGHEALGHCFPRLPAAPVVEPHGHF